MVEFLILVAKSTYSSACKVMKNFLYIKLIFSKVQVRKAVE